MIDTNAPNDDLERRMEEIANQSAPKIEAPAQAAQAQQVHTPPPAAGPDKKKWGLGKKTAAYTGGAIGVGVLATGYVITKVVGFVYPPKPKKLAQAGLSLGVVYFMLNPLSCSRQIVKGASDYLIKPGKKIVYGQDKIKELQKERDAANAKIKDLMTVKKQPASLEQQVDRGYGPVTAQPIIKQPIYVEHSAALEKEPFYFVHKRGQTLAGIASEVTGDASNWRQIANHNGLSKERGTKDVYIILLGQPLKIPERMVRDSSAVSYLAEKEGAGWFDHGCVPTKRYIRSPDESFESAVNRVTGNPGDAVHVMKYNRQLIKDFDRGFEEIYFPKELIRNPRALTSR